MLAKALKCCFIDADDYHPQANKGNSYCLQFACHILLFGFVTLMTGENCINIRKNEKWDPSI